MPTRPHVVSSRSVARSGAALLVAGLTPWTVAQTSAGSQTTPASAPASTTQATPDAGAGPAQAGIARVHGVVADPDGAVIPGATVQFTPKSGSAKRATSGPDGSYTLPLTPGIYNLLVSMKGFSTYQVQSLTVPPVASLTVNAKLLVGEQQVVVNVDADAVQLSVDPESNASSTVLQGKDLDALSDDPDELSSELTALAGPAAGPNGGQIYVDGFTGGQLPPKSSIREIRTNQNPFSAQYDRVGYGRVEVFTKPGTDKWHGNFQMNGNPSQFNSPNPFSPTTIPPYHTIFSFGNITGPLNKSTSVSVGGSYRDIQDNEFTNVQIPVATAGSTTPCAPGDPTCNFDVKKLPFTPIYTPFPQQRYDISPRFDFALGEKNVLTARFQFVQNDTTNAGVGSITLPSAAYNINFKNEEIQLSDTQTWSSKLINETRFEYERDRNTNVPRSNAPFIIVQGTFQYGGNPTQNTSDHQDHFEVQNYTSVALSKNFIRFGGRVRTNREAQYAAGNTNGSFTYASPTFNPPTTCNAATAADPTCQDHSYATGTPSQFSLTVLNTPNIHFTYADLGLYAEDDWKVKPNLTLSYGLRYETQNYLPDHHDFAPRLGIAYGLGNGKGAPKTVLRSGFGLFYDRFGNGYILNLARFNGTASTLYTLTTVPTGCAPNVPNAIATCRAEANATSTSIFSEATGQLAPRLRTPYLTEFAGGIDQQAGRRGTISVNYIHSQGVHQLNLQNAAYPTDGTLPAALAPVNNQYFSEGAFRQDQLFINGRVQTSKWLSLFGYYSLNFAKGDSSGGGTPISVPYNIQADYGRTLFDTRNRAFIAGSITLPYFIQVSPYVQAQSGSPYNVTIGSDPLQDSYFNERPEAVPLSMANGNTVKAIPSCGLAFAQPGSVPGYSTAPINACTGPNLFTFNFRLTKTIGFGEKLAANRGGGGGGRGGPGGGGPGGGGGGRGGPGGFGGGGGASTGQRYNLGFGVNVQNLFNNTDPALPISVLNSSSFGQSINLQGYPFTQQSAVRRISVQASFNF